MKIGTKILMLIFITGALFQACSKVDPPYYTIKSVYADTNMRSVIVEDYTGHLCTNCPPAAFAAQAFQEAYKNQVFAISVHAGGFAVPDPNGYGGLFKADFRSPDGTAWYNYAQFNIDVNPKGMVNRVPYKGDQSFMPDQWAGAIAAAVALPKLAIISVHNTYDSVQKVLNTTVGTRFLKSIPGKINLCVCILEDNIYGGQMNNVGDSIPYYKHFKFMDVLRGSLNGTWGSEISSSPGVNEVHQVTYSVDFKQHPDWVGKNCSILAFIMNPDSKEIFHSAKAPVINP